MTKRIGDIARKHHDLTNFDPEQTWLSSDRLLGGTEKVGKIYQKLVIQNIFIHICNFSGSIATQKSCGIGLLGDNPKFNIDAGLLAYRLTKRASSW